MFKKLLTLSLSLSLLLIPLSSVSADINPAVALASVVYVGSPKDKSSHGSGFWKSKTEIITAKHVATTLNYESVIRDFQGRFYKIKSIVASEESDITIITIEGEALDGTEVASINCELPPYLTPIVSIGHPLHMRNIMGLGHVLGTYQGPETDGSLNLVTNLSVGPGSSGGPVFNQDGSVIGILVSIFLAPGPSGGGDTIALGMTNVLPMAVVPQLCKPKIPEEGKPN